MFIFFLNYWVPTYVPNCRKVYSKEKEKPHECNVKSPQEARNQYRQCNTDSSTFYSSVLPDDMEDVNVASVRTNKNQANDGLHEQPAVRDTTKSAKSMVHFADGTVPCSPMIPPTEALGSAIFGTSESDSSTFYSSVLPDDMEDVNAASVRTIFEYVYELMHFGRTQNGQCMSMTKN